MGDLIHSLKNLVDKIKKEGMTDSLVSDFGERVVALKSELRQVGEASHRIHVQSEKDVGEISEEWQTLRSIDIENRFYSKEIESLQCAERDALARFDDPDIISLAEYSAENPAKDGDDDLDVERRRLAAELEERERLERKLKELVAAKKTLATTRASKQRNYDLFGKEVESLLKGVEGSGRDVRESDPPPKIRSAVESLPLPLRIIYCEFKACKEALGLDIEVLIRDRTDTKRSKPSSTSDSPYGFKNNLVVILKIFEDKSSKILTVMEFRERRDLVFVLTGTGRLLSQSLFVGDTGAQLPSTMVPGLKSGKVGLDKKKHGLPFRWAQLLGGVDFLPKPHEDKDSPEVRERVKSGLERYREEQRPLRFLERVREQNQALDTYRSCVNVLGNKGAAKRLHRSGDVACPSCQLKEFKFVKESFLGGPPSRRRAAEGAGTSASPIDLCPEEKKAQRIKNRFRIYEARLECEGYKLLAKFCFPFTEPDRPLIVVESIWSKQHTLEAADIEGAKKWMTAQLSGTHALPSEPNLHVMALMETFDCWVQHTSAKEKMVLVPAGRSRSIKAAGKRKRELDGDEED